MSKIVEILADLSTTNNALRDEIIMLCSMKDPSECQQLFKNIRQKLFPGPETKRIQDMCIEKGIDTSFEYSMNRGTLLPDDFPEDPRPANTTWYDFLHPDRLRVKKFYNNVLEVNNLNTAHEYDNWRMNQPPHLQSSLPLVQHIMDGYFGPMLTSFNNMYALN